MAASDTLSVSYATRRVAALKRERSSFDSTYRELSEHILPRASRWYLDDRNKGDRRTSKILNDTATWACGVAAAGLHGGLTSPSRPWFQLGHTDPVISEMKSAKVWFSDTQAAMFSVFARSNLYQVLPVFYQDLLAFGTGAFLELEDDQDVVRFVHCLVGTYWLGVSHRGRVDTFAREFQMTSRQLADQFGKDALSPEVLADLESNRPEEKNWNVCHLIEPNRWRRQSSPFARDKAWTSVYWILGQQTFLDESGFDEFPVITGRWSVAGEDVYATMCPGWQTLGDNKALQHGEKRGWEAVDKFVRPPKKAPLSMKNSPTSDVPGGISFIPMGAGDAAYGPVYQLDPRGIEILRGEKAQLEGRVKRGFHVDLWLMLDSMDRTNGVTAYEIAEKKQEKMLVLGPILERLNDEAFDPLVKRTGAIMHRRGLISEAPPELLQAGPLTVEYISILAQAQKLVGIQALERIVAFIEARAAANPEALDKLDLDTAIDEYASRLGASPKVVRDAKEVVARRQARQQAQAQAQAAANLQAGAGAARDLGQAQVTDDTALGQMVSRLTGGVAV